jgi:hypothetical protein
MSHAMIMPRSWHHGNAGPVRDGHNALAAKHNAPVIS